MLVGLQGWGLTPTPEQEAPMIGGAGLLSTALCVKGMRLAAGQARARSHQPWAAAGNSKKWENACKLAVPTKFSRTTLKIQCKN